MKTFTLSTLLLVICLFLTVKGDCQYEGRTLTEGKNYFNCKQYTCSPNGNIAVLGCSLYQCAKGKQIGYKEEDLSKPYPQCCGGPICAS
ncbi:unnamed protein product [Xylocopa violacea]|uniref:Single domain-containing protein n=1 Tax=Xylocopa violacea TaxID=135666 RepID=A0ABP1PE62_XYLVO